MARINTNGTSGHSNQQRSNQSNNDDTSGFIKRDQIYRMLDKFFHTLNAGVSHESFASASTLYSELSNCLDLSEYVSLGESWRNLYVLDNEQGYISLKETVGKIKSRFA